MQLQGFFLQADKDLLIFLNGFHSPFFDEFMYQATLTLPWVPLYGLLIWFIVRTYGWQSLWVLLAVALVVTAADQFTSTFMKPYFERLRPCWEPAMVPVLHIPRGCGGQFGFASSHAADTFGAGTLVFLVLRGKYRWAPFIFVWPAVSSYSRIYLAAHYPGDVLVGALIGVCLGYMAFEIFKRSIRGQGIQ